MPQRPSNDPLPPPDDEALERSGRLAALIGAEITAAGGWIGFDRYMHLALNAPGLGYYAADSAKFGPAGDFVTAPELSDALARAMAAALAPALETMDAPAVLELGAGTGTLAAQLLAALDERGLGAVRYLILETSAALRQRQQAALSGAGQVEWLDKLPSAPLTGAIVANEVADALPVTCFAKRGGETVPVGVRRAGDGFAWADGAPDLRLSEAVQRVETRLGGPLPPGYRSEISLRLPGWIGALAACLGRGALLLVDYGYVRRDYYRPERDRGTLLCHYRHRAHDDPFRFPGLQDISAWVDFSACADAALAARLDVAGFTTQAQFMMGALGESLLRARERASPQALGALKTLLMPGEMGERFKVLLATRGLAGLALPGRDLRGRL